MPTEIWKDIKGYEGLYQISNFGNVKRIQSNKYIKPHNEKGYIRVALCKNNKVKHLYHLINNYPSVIKASLITGINHGNICSCCEGRRKTAGNYIWSYLKLGGD